MYNKYCFEYSNERLTPQELKARDVMVNIFNPVLKFIFLGTNESEFKKYGYNSCRQTAILGSYFVKKLLPDYEIKAYEGNFIDHDENKDVKYVHAFIIAKKDKRELIIDLSRTEKRLLFHPIFGENIYPQTKEYGVVEFINKKEINLPQMLNMEEGEYYTSMKPSELILVIDKLMDDLKEDTAERRTFTKLIYQSTTYLE